MSILKWKRIINGLAFMRMLLKNRLMRTANLSDLTDKTAALKQSWFNWRCRNTSP